MSPRSKEQFEDTRTRSREKIMAAALELFAREGYHAASISKIARQAGVSKGLMYNYFQSKTELLDAIVGMAFAGIEDEYLQIMALHDPYERLAAITDLTFDIASRDKQRWQLLTAVMTQLEVMAHIRQHTQAYFKAFVTALEQIFSGTEVADPRAEAYKFAALLDGVLLHYCCIFDDDYPLQQIKEQILKDHEKIMGHQPAAPAGKPKQP